MTNPLLLWAKSPAKGQSNGYPLLPHLLDVAAVAAELQKLIHCPVPMPCSSSWVAALVGFHDLGKATPGFQRRLGRDSIPNYSFPPAAPDRHDASTVPLLMNQLIEQMKVDQREARLMALAVGAHHGHVVTSVDEREASRSAKYLDEVWHKTHKYLFIQLLKGVNTKQLPTLPCLGPQRSAFLQWLMGLTTVSDWIGSSEALCRWDRLDLWNNDCAKWFMDSKRLANEALSESGLAAAALRKVDSGSGAVRLALGGMKPRPLQKSIAQMLDDLGDKASLVIIEAPMGEGKTEAGFGCATNCRGLYVAMPTQATSNALLDRLTRFLNRAVDNKTQFALAHGAGGPKVAASRLQEIGLGTADSKVTAGEWFRGSKRSLLAPQGIGTVDQALIGVLNTRHGFVRLFGLTGRTVILDEVHAYDIYTAKLIERLVVWLQQLGCRVILMSATLPSAKRNAILRAWAGDEVALPSDPYPRISWALPDSIQSISFQASRKQRALVRGIDPDEVIAQAMTMAKAGARVLLIVNKVTRAQELYRGITGVNCTLFHARFPMDERITIEKRVLEMFGPSGCEQAGHILVATQVAEQSLDIDMDVLITDPAPVDLVLQRSGRVHRHSRQRPPGFEEALVLVTGLDRELPPGDLTRFIYDRWIVLKSHAWLRSHPVLELPTDIDLAVQKVYDETWEDLTSEKLRKAVVDAWPEHRDNQQRMAQQADQAALAKPRDWSFCGNTPLMDDDDAESGALQFGTRLGSPTLSVIPVFPGDLESLASQAERLSMRWLRISDTRLIKAIRSSPLPAGWSTCSGLVHHHAMLLDADGLFRDGDRVTRLDHDLGLVISYCET